MAPTRPESGGSMRPTKVSRYVQCGIDALHERRRARDEGARPAARCARVPGQAQNQELKAGTSLLQGRGRQVAGVSSIRQASQAKVSSASVRAAIGEGSPPTSAERRRRTVWSATTRSGRTAVGHSAPSPEHPHGLVPPILYPLPTIPPRVLTAVTDVQVSMSLYPHPSQVVRSSLRLTGVQSGGSPEREVEYAQTMT
jgi:hypothetical protein